MTLSIIELARARETAAALLEELGLDAYLYEVEPRGDRWEVKVECAADGGDVWGRVAVSLPKDTLLNLPDDVGAHQRVLDEWRQRFSACKVRGRDGGE